MMRFTAPRLLVQVTSAVASNAYLPGFLSGRLYTGAAKRLCVPFLNCYSCPGALGSCPVGAIQSLAASGTLSLYVVGLVLGVGAAVGRAPCGWLCPFGLVQDLLARLSRRRLALPRALRLGKYAILVLLVPLAAWWTGGADIGAPHFCTYLCPAGTLGAALPLLAVNRQLWALAGGLLAWRVALLLAILGASAVVNRPFCQALCPLGAAYGLLNPVSRWRLAVDGRRCTACGSCQGACPLALDPASAPNQRECIRCLSCQRACPQAAIRFGSELRAITAEGGVRT